jgi:hypothetical protein
MIRHEDDDGAKPSLLLMVMAGCFDRGGADLRFAKVILTAMPCADGHEKYGSRRYPERDLVIKVRTLILSRH